MTDHPARARLLTLAQEEVPLVERPYKALGERAGMSERAAIATFEGACSSGLIRETSGIFEAEALGYHSTLAAIKAPGEHLDKAADVVSRHTGVSHNYSRDHEFSLWFTLSVPRERDMDQEIAVLAEKAGGYPWRSFPTLRRYKIGVRFDMAGEAAASLSDSARKAEPVALDEATVQAVRALQVDLPRLERPFDAVATEFGFTGQELLEAARRLKEAGALRRYASVVRHRKAGYGFNVMSAWDIPDDRMDEAGQALAEFPSVSHCYERPTFPDWPYGLFGMIHARTETAGQQMLERAREALRPRKYALLRSVKEYKKDRVRYFVPPRCGGGDF